MNPQRTIRLGFGASVLGSIVFVVAVATGGSHAAIGLGATLAFAGLALAFGTWSASLPPREVVERRDDAPEEVALPELSRSRLLTWALAAAGALVVAALAPLRALAPASNARVSQWGSGKRLVGVDGRPLTRDALNPDAVVTAFPEGHAGDPDSQTVLVRLRSSDEILSAERRALSPEGYVAFSKVCTHAGCPVALYRAAQRQLMCPCHQSVFDVLDGARVISGPASRPLPQLALEIDGEGYLRSRGDFDGPIGPGRWDPA